MKITIQLLSALVLLSIFQACDSNPYPGFEMSEGGLAYKIFKKDSNPNKQTPKEGDLLYMEVKYEAEDTVFFDSYTQPGNMLVLNYPTCSYTGSIDECLIKMTKGDSALMWTSADSFYTKLMHTDLPKKIKKGSRLYFTVSLKEIVTKEQMAISKEAQLKELEKMSAENKEKEPQLIKEYLKEKNITDKPTASGLYIVVDKKGNGPKAKAGENVTVHYTGTFLNGKVFDSSIERGEPIEFPAGVGQVIPGWDEALLALPEGTEARLVIPSKLAYGEEGRPPVIYPNTPLTFVIKILKVSSK